MRLQYTWAHARSLLQRQMWVQVIKFHPYVHRGAIVAKSNSWKMGYILVDVFQQCCGYLISSDIYWHTEKFLTSGGEINILGILKSLHSSNRCWNHKPEEHFLQTVQTKFGKLGKSNFQFIHFNYFWLPIDAFMPSKTQIKYSDFISWVHTAVILFCVASKLRQFLAVSYSILPHASLYFLMHIFLLLLFYVGLCTKFQRGS